MQTYGTARPRIGKQKAGQPTGIIGRVRQKSSKRKGKRGKGHGC